MSAPYSFLITTIRKSFSRRFRRLPNIERVSCQKRFWRAELKKPSFPFCWPTTHKSWSVIATVAWTILTQAVRPSFTPNSGMRVNLNSGPSQSNVSCRGIETGRNDLNIQFQAWACSKADKSLLNRKPGSSNKKHVVWLGASQLQGTTLYPWRQAQICWTATGECVTWYNEFISLCSWQTQYNQAWQPHQLE